MNKKMIVLCCIFITLWVLICAGCAPTVPNLPPQNIDGQDIRRINPLPLQKAEDQQANVWDVNQTPPPAEIKLSLEQCRAAALENNLQLKATLINPTITAEQVQQERARFDAVFRSSASLTKTDSPSVNQLAQITGTTTERSDARIGLDVPLVTGGTLSGQLVDNQLKDYPGSTFNPYYAPSSTLSFQQPLLQNAGTATATYAIRISDYEQQITDTQTRLEVIRTIADLDRVYWRLYAAQKELEVRQQQYQLAQAQLDTAKRRVELGEDAQIEITRAEAGAAQRVEAIIQAKNTLRDRQRELKRAMNKPNLSMQTPTRIIVLTEPQPMRYDLDKEHLVEFATENRMEMLELQLQLARDAATIDYRRNQTLPALAFSYNYNVGSYGGSRSNAYDVLWKNQFAGHTFGLNLEIPVGNHAATSRLRQAMYERIQQLATREDRRSEIEMEVLNAVDQLEANWQRIMASRQNTILNQKLYEAEKRQNEQGLRTSTDVLNAQTQFADAQLSELSALVDYQIALVDLAYATGTLLGAANIEWSPAVPAIN